MTTSGAFPPSYRTVCVAVRVQCVFVCYLCIVWLVVLCGGSLRWWARTDIRLLQELIMSTIEAEVGRTVDPFTEPKLERLDKLPGKFRIA